MQIAHENNEMQIKLHSQRLFQQEIVTRMSFNVFILQILIVSNVMAIQLPQQNSAKTKVRKNSFNTKILSRDELNKFENVNPIMQKNRKQILFHMVIFLWKNFSQTKSFDKIK